MPTLKELGELGISIISTSVGIIFFLKCRNKLLTL